MAASRPFWACGRIHAPSTASFHDMVVSATTTTGSPFQNNNSKLWRMLGLQEALLSLEGGLLSQPSVEDLASILKMCRKERDAVYGLRLHGYICKVGLEGHALLGNLLVQTLVDTGSMLDAQQVFDILMSRNEWSWTSLINGYVKTGKPQNAFNLYEKMLSEDFIQPSGHTFVVLLKACVKMIDIEKGEKLHAEVARRGLLEKDPFVGSTLVDMYAKCGLIVKAQEVFDRLLTRDVVSWTALIAGYSEGGHGEEALALLEKMQCEGIPPDAVTFVCGLKASIVLGAIAKGQELHEEIERRGSVSKDRVVGNTLVHMYATFGMLSQAQEVFDKLPLHDVVSWTALITGYAEQSKEDKALDCFEKMQQMGFSPNALTFACILRACGNSKLLQRGEEIHAMIEKQGPPLEKDLYVGCALVDMYTKFGILAKARQVFDKISSRTVVLWNVLINGYVEHGQCEEALTCFELMKLEGLFADAVTFIGSLKACGSLGATSRGAQIHAEIEIHKLSQSDTVVGSTLVDMYVRCGLLGKAHQVFEKLPVREAASWTSLITGYAEVAQGDAAIKCFEQMQHEGVVPDIAALLCSLKACTAFGAMDKAQLIHGEIERLGTFKQDVTVGNTLVSVYAKFGRLDIAQEVLENLSSRDAVTWTSLITGYVDQGQDEEAIVCFYQMQAQGFCPSAVSYVCCLKACGSAGDANTGYEFHAEIERRGLLENEPTIGNSLVYMYAKCGLLGLAKQVFDRLPVKGVFSWAALIAGYDQVEKYEDAVDCYKRMQNEGVSPDAITFVACLKACGSIGAIDMGLDIHMDAERIGLMDRDPMVGTSVIHMYVRCGYLSKAHEVFNRLPLSDVASWTALMGGYVQYGQAGNALSFFEQMLGEGLKPDPATFVILLSACSKTGLYKKGEVLFEAMSKDHGVVPVLEHYNCMVGVLVRAGHLTEVVTLMKRVPIHWHAEVWQTVLGACRSVENLDLGKEAFQHMVGLDDSAVIAYVFMSHLLAAATTTLHIKPA